jgi:hypothetical protein
MPRARGGRSDARSRPPDSHVLTPPPRTPTQCQLRPSFQPGTHDAAVSTTGTSAASPSSSSSNNTIKHARGEIWGVGIHFQDGNLENDNLRDACSVLARCCIDRWGVSGVRTAAIPQAGVRISFSVYLFYSFSYCDFSVNHNLYQVGCFVLRHILLSREILQFLRLFLAIAKVTFNQWFTTYVQFTTIQLDVLFRVAKSSRNGT